MHSSIWRSPEHSPALGSLLLLGALLLLPAGAAADVLEFGTRAHPSFGRVHMEGVREVRGRDATPEWELKPWGHMGDAGNLLYLSFDEEVPALLRDAAGHYRLETAAYAPSDDSRVGRRSALFVRREHRIVVRSPEELWPGRGPLDDFTIEFWLKPVHFSRKNTIFRKQSLEPTLTSQSPAGIEIFIRDGRVHVLLQSVFRDMQGRTRSLQLVSRTQVRRRTWQHVVFGYEAARGRAVLYVGGREERVASARDRAGIWTASFSRLDRSPILIAESYLGLLDEFRIASGVPRGEDSLRNSMYPSLRYNPVHLNARQITGRLTSKVMRLPGERPARRAALQVTGTEPAGSALNFFVRTSNRPFTDRTPASSVPWRLVDSRAHLSDFAYWQWRAELRADPMGDRSPRLQEVRLEYTPYSVPVPPQQPGVVRELTRGERVTIEWTRNPELEVAGSGGYIIYYGYRPGEYLGRLQFVFEDGKARPINFRPIETLPLTPAERRLRARRPDAFARQFTNRIRLVVTNELIEENIVHLNRVPDDVESPPRPRSAGKPLLTRNRTYYVALSAYYRTPTGLVIESPLSKEVVAVLRPARERR